MAYLGKAAADRAGRETEQLTDLAGIVARCIAQGKQPPFFRGEQSQQTGGFHRVQCGIRFSTVLFREKGAEQLLLLCHPAELVTVEIPCSGKQPGFALPFRKAVDKAPVLQCPQKDFLGQILRPGLVPAEIETEVFQPVPEGLVQQLPHGASSFHCVVLPVRRRRPGKCWIDPEKNKPSVSLALASSPTRGAFGMAVNSVKLRETP